MPKLCEVVSLQDLSVSAVGKLIVHIATAVVQSIFKRPRSERNEYVEQSYSQLQKLLLTHIPHFMYDEVAAHLIKTVQHLTLLTEDNFSYEQCVLGLSELNVIERLMVIVFTPNLKRLQLTYCPEFLRYQVSNNLHKLSGLVVLDLGTAPFRWNRRNNNESMVEAIRVMKNLRKLCLHHHCADDMIQALGDHCRQLQVLDVSSSCRVTDISVCYLIKCEKLTSVQLHGTSVTVVGVARLMLGLPHLQDVGRVDQLDSVLKFIFKRSLLESTLNLRKFHTLYLSPECLQNLVKVCPNVDQIGLFHTDQITDLSIVASFKSLKELKLCACSFYLDSLYELLKSRGLGIHILHLENISDFDSNAIYIIGQCCPNLRTLILKNCDVDNHLYFNSKLYVKPFQNLETLFWQIGGSQHDIKYILSYAINIRIVDFGALVDITHSIISDILDKNKMVKLEELRISFSSNFSLETIRLLLWNCTELRVLTYLRNCGGICPQDVSKFIQYLKKNNINLVVY